MMTSELAAKLIAAAQEEGPRKRGEEPKNSYGFPWSVSITGPGGRALLVYERQDRPGVVYVRWQATAEERARLGGGARPRREVPLSRGLRDGRGRLSKRACDEAAYLARGVFEQWQSATAPTEEAEEPAVMTIRGAFAYAAHPDTGILSNERWRKWVFGRAVDGVRASAIQVIERIIGLDRPMASWTIEDARKVWRTLARESTDGSGARAAEQIVGAVYTIADHCDANCRRPPKWRRELREDWHRITGVEPAPKRERYEPHELAALVRGLRETDDVRLRAAGLYGLGYRRGQVVRVKRSMLNLEVVGAYSAGQLEIPSSPGKPAGIVDLTAAMRRFFVHELEQGYLSALEAARVNGLIKDYYILPGGRLQDGVAPVSSADTHIHRDELGRRLIRLEKSVGVTHKARRGWHGLRRSMSDEIAEETNDETVRDMAQGYLPGGGTRAKLYMDKEHERKRVKAAEARNAALRRLAGVGGVADAIVAELDAARRLVVTLQTLSLGSFQVELGNTLEVAEELARLLEGVVADLENAPQPKEIYLRVGEDDRHDELALAIRKELDLRALTGKDAAALLGTSQANTSLIRRGKTRRMIKLETLEKLLSQARVLPKGGG